METVDGGACSGRLGREAGGVHKLKQSKAEENIAKAEYERSGKCEQRAAFTSVVGVLFPQISSKDILFLLVFLCSLQPLDPLTSSLRSPMLSWAQCPAGSRKIPGSRDQTQIPIPGLLKIKSRDFSLICYSTEDNVYKDFYLFSDSQWVFFVLPEPFKVLQIFALQTLTDLTIYQSMKIMKSKERFQLLTF